MTYDQVTKYKPTRQEEERMWHIDSLSDMDMSVDGSFAIEWDGVYGRHWEYFATEEEQEARLKRHNEEEMRVFFEVRKEIQSENIEKGRRMLAEKRLAKEAKTLGGMCPELGELLNEMR